MLTVADLCLNFVYAYLWLCVCVHAHYKQIGEYKTDHVTITNQSELPAAVITHILSKVCESPTVHIPHTENEFILICVADHCLDERCVATGFVNQFKHIADQIALRCMLVLLCVLVNYTTGCELS
jgi:hypothetical protein